ncbi:UEV-domain-containing protein [Backusella circina FSU 941]|nr:UEV-domain-containing protein [Backusella circina FSU 941]
MDIKSWLRTVLQHAEYTDQERTFRDVDAVLQMYLSLKPKMDTYTSNDGHTQLLLCIYGTVPITYRAIPYNIPVAFWIPKDYPKSSPIPYVKPTPNMLIREGRHVDKSGMCYHQYRSSWSSDQKHTFLELVAILQHIFAQDPPVYSKPLGAPPPPPQQQQQQQESMERVSSPQHRQSLPTTSATTSPSLQHSSPQNNNQWKEGTALYNMNQGLANLNRPNNSLTKSSSLPSMPIQESNEQDALVNKISEKLNAYNVMISGDMDLLLQQNRQLNEGDASIEHEYRTLLGIKENLRFNIGVLETREEEIDHVTERVNGMPDVAVDEALCGTSVVANQLFELVADDNAISDTMYFLAKALNSERIDLAVFMKCTRILAREQFMKRALVKKITELK